MLKRRRRKTRSERGLVDAFLKADPSVFCAANADTLLQDDARKIPVMCAHIISLELYAKFLLDNSDAYTEQQVLLEARQKKIHDTQLRHIRTMRADLTSNQSLF